MNEKLVITFQKEDIAAKVFTCVASGGFIDGFSKASNAQHQFLDILGEQQPIPAGYMVRSVEIDLDPATKKFTYKRFATREWEEVATPRPQPEPELPSRLLPLMTQEDADKLPTGVYRIYWASWSEGGNGSSSLAVLARGADGAMKFAPANWVCQFSKEWNRIKGVELIERASKECLG